MSFRASGWSFIILEGFAFLRDYGCVKAPALGNVTFNNLSNGLDGLKHSAESLNKTIQSYTPDIIIIEMPVFSQSAKSAIMIGMCWGVVASLMNQRTLLVEPSALKLWSESKRGDKKKSVKEEVMKRFSLSPKTQANDNILDAIGLGLILCDKIQQLRYYDKTNQPTDNS